jgi:hypothetical protein
MGIPEVKNTYASIQHFSSFNSTSNMQLLYTAHFSWSLGQIVSKMDEVSGHWEEKKKVIQGLEVCLKWQSACLASVKLCVQTSIPTTTTKNPTDLSRQDRGTVRGSIVLPMKKRQRPRTVEEQVWTGREPGPESPGLVCHGQECEWDSQSPGRP